MSHLMSIAHAMRGDHIFVIAAARAFYCEWYMSDPRRARPIQRNHGCEITEMVPETESWALSLGRRLALDLVRDRGANDIDHLCVLWAAESEKADPVHVDRDPTEENLGFYAAMQSMGTGTNLERCGVTATVPRFEAHPQDVETSQNRFVAKRTGHDEAAAYWSEATKKWTDRPHATLFTELETLTVGFPTSEPATWEYIT